MKIDEIYQHKVLFWGILGVIVIRFVMITIGVSIVQKFGWILYFFSGILIFMGLKILIKKKEDHDSIKNNKFMILLKKIIPHTDEIKDNSFFVKKIDPQTQKQKILATPLFLALIFIEFVDLVFAIDSLPAIFAITTDKYIIYTSNIFAILGLRALYFALSEINNRFKYIKYALGILLIFIGSKIFIAKILGLEKFPAELSLLITILILASGIVFSLYKTKSENKKVVGF
jgi:tellurite resistance protein TerC